jgi:hypothetical protein
LACFRGTIDCCHFLLADSTFFSRLLLLDSEAVDVEVGCDLSDGINSETHEQSEGRYKDNCGHPALGQKVVPNSSLLLKAFGQDYEGYFIE